MTNWTRDSEGSAHDAPYEVTFRLDLTWAASQEGEWLPGGTDTIGEVTIEIDPTRDGEIPENVQGALELYRDVAAYDAVDVLVPADELQVEQEDDDDGSLEARWGALDFAVASDEEIAMVHALSSKVLPLCTWTRLDTGASVTHDLDPQIIHARGEMEGDGLWDVWSVLAGLLGLRT